MYVPRPLCEAVLRDDADNPCCRAKDHRGKHRSRHGKTWKNTVRPQVRRYVPPHRRDSAA